MHHAAILNHAGIITSLMLAGADSNLKQHVDYVAVGPMPVHYAARCGSLDALACLTANYANVNYADHQGWTAIHHAAYFDSVPTVRLLARHQPELVEICTRGSTSGGGESSPQPRRTPLLIAASGGALACVKCLIEELGANRGFNDEWGYNVVHVAALRYSLYSVFFCQYRIYFNLSFHFIRKYFTYSSKRIYPI